MVVDSKALLAAMYETDETAWLDRMAELIELNHHEQLDYGHLKEFLRDMAQRDRREVVNRLIVLIAHVLKWDHQPDRRGGSCESTIDHQRGRLARLLASKVLWRHAEESLDKAYETAVKHARKETGLPPETFPAQCPYTLDSLLTDPDKPSDSPA